MATVTAMTMNDNEGAEAEGKKSRHRGLSDHVLLHAEILLDQTRLQ